MCMHICICLSILPRCALHAAQAQVEDQDPGPLEDVLREGGDEHEEEHVHQLRGGLGAAQVRAHDDRA